MTDAALALLIELFAAAKRGSHSIICRDEKRAAAIELAGHGFVERWFGGAWSLSAAGLKYVEDGVRALHVIPAYQRRG